jgi:Tol biopolymer transport system component
MTTTLRLAAIALVLAGCSSRKNPGLKPATPELPTLTKPYIAYSAITPDSFEVRLKPASGPDIRLEGLDPSTQSVAIAPDGRHLAFMQMSSGQFDIFVANVDGTGVVNITNDNQSQDVRPHWSKDGGRIYYTRLSDVPPAAAAGPLAADRLIRALALHSPALATSYVSICSVRLDGTDRTQVYSDNLTYLLDVTPDNTHMLCGRYTGLWLIDTSTGEARQLDTLHVQVADYSPDGSKIAICRGAPSRSDIEVMDADAGNRQNLTTGLVGTAWSPSWSPDGTQIAFLAGASASALQLVTMKSDGSDLQEQTQDAQDLDPCWGPKP